MLKRGHWLMMHIGKGKRVTASKGTGLPIVDTVSIHGPNEQIRAYTVMIQDA
jgi:hypothetical protein